MSAPSASTSSRAASGSTRVPASCAVATIQRMASSSFTRASSTMPQCSPSVSLQAVEAVLVVHVHAAHVGGDAQKIGDEDQQSLRIGRAEVAVESGELVFLGAARIELAHVAHEDDLEGRHQRGRLRAVEHLEDGRRPQVEVGQTEVLQVRRNEGLHHGGAAAFLQKQLVPGQHIAGLEPAAGSSAAASISPTKRPTAVNPAPQRPALT